MNAPLPIRAARAEPLAGRTVAMTGASGRLGPILARAFAQAGARVIGFSRDPRAMAARCPEVEAIASDRIGEVLCSRQIDALIDLAALNNSVKAPREEFHAVNVARLGDLLCQADRAKVPVVIAVSSIHALLLGRSDAYAATKREARELVLARPDARCRLLTLPKVTAAVPGTLAGFAWSLAGVLKPVAYAESVAAAAVAMVAEGRDGAREVFVESAADPRTVEWASRVLDWAAALAIVVFLGWLMLLLAVAIRLDSPGPSIFAQRRVGKDERPFTLYKFRTMGVGTAQAGTHEVSVRSVTRVGAILRKLKLDELPQALNILRGELGLVGPRPCLTIQHELIAERRRRGIFAVRPGLTGLAQIHGVDMSDPRRLVEWEARYLQVRGLALDLAIVVRTFLGQGSGDRTAG